MRLTAPAEADMRKMLVKMTLHAPQSVLRRLRRLGTDDFLVTFIAGGSWV